MKILKTILRVILLEIPIVISIIIILAIPFFIGWLIEDEVDETNKRNIDEKADN